MKLCQLDDLSLVSVPGLPPELLGLFTGVWAYRTFGGTPALTASGDLPESARAFALVSEELVGAVLVDELNPAHRRCAVHVGLYPHAQGKGLAQRALVMTGAVLGDCFGVERFQTYALEGSPGHRVALQVGLEEEGRLRGFVWTPDGRLDMLLLGGLWSTLRERLRESLDRIAWTAPHEQ